MANLLYNILIQLYWVAAKLTSTFSKKAKLFVLGRKNIWQELQKHFPKQNVVWFHAASLGEFEQGKPVMELLKKKHPEINLLVTFFSPSGFEQRKDYELADVFYLPLDTKKNAKRFIDIVNPQMAVFIRYEFWANYLDALRAKQIPTAVMAAQFRKDQFAFGFWGGFIRQRIKNLNLICVQYQSAKSLLLEHSFNADKVSVCGDSRFDRVLETVKNTEEIPEIKSFKGDSPLVILGSCYEAEENFVREAFEKFPDWKFIYAPHYVDDQHVDGLISRLPAKAVKFTNYKEGNERILVLNTIGKLASAYRYGDLAVIGGGFRDGIHNILEAAAFGLPLFFGPNHKSFPEAQALLDLGLAFEIDKKGIAEKNLDALLRNSELRNQQSQKLKSFVTNHAGATSCIVKNLEKLL